MTLKQIVFACFSTNAWPTRSDSIQSFFNGNFFFFISLLFCVHLCHPQSIDLQWHTECVLWCQKGVKIIWIAFASASMSALDRAAQILIFVMFFFPRNSFFFSFIFEKTKFVCIFYLKANHSDEEEEEEKNTLTLFHCKYAQIDSIISISSEIKYAKSICSLGQPKAFQTVTSSQNRQSIGGPLCIEREKKTKTERKKEQKKNETINTGD